MEKLWSCCLIPDKVGLHTVMFKMEAVGGIIYSQYAGHNQTEIIPRGERYKVHCVLLIIDLAFRKFGTPAR